MGWPQHVVPTGAVPEPKTAKNRLHFDLRPISSLDAEVERLFALGASVADRYETHVVMRDPEGNEFCMEPGMEDPNDWSG